MERDENCAGVDDDTDAAAAWWEKSVAESPAVFRAQN